MDISFSRVFIMNEMIPDHIQYWLTEANHDCFFVVGPDNGPTQRIGALKSFLMGYSKPFRAMLQDSELAEKEDIHIKDVEPETFRDFLKCVYGAKSVVVNKFTFEEGAKLLYLAEKYLVNDIKTEISDHLIELFSYEKIFSALSHPVCYYDRVLKKKILKELETHFHKIVKDKRYLCLDYTAILFILEELEYSNLKEIRIWNATLQWAKHKTNSTDGSVLRSCIFKFLKFIRFLTMGYSDFWTIVVKSNILIKGEVYEICKYFGTGEPLQIRHLCALTNSRSKKASQGLSNNATATKKNVLRH